MSNESSSNLTKDFLEAHDSGKILLHPTDTIVGVGFNPSSQEGLENLFKLKGSREGKSFVTLAGSSEIAFEYFAPLPGKWRDVLDQVWPAPLSVIWRASSICPSCLLALDGTVAIRVPKLLDPWFEKVLFKLGSLLPTTSVNRSGSPSFVDWGDAKQFVDGSGVPSYTKGTMAKREKSLGASTLIKIIDESSFQVLRKGQFDPVQLEGLIRD